MKNIPHSLNYYSFYSQNMGLSHANFLLAFYSYTSLNLTTSTWAINIHIGITILELKEGYTQKSSVNFNINYSSQLTYFSDKTIAI